MKKVSGGLPGSSSTVSAATLASGLALPLADLRARVEAATGRVPYSSAELVVWRNKLGISHAHTLARALDGELDAAIELVAEKLPTWTGMVDFGGHNAHAASLWGPLKELGADFEGLLVEIQDEAVGEAKTPAGAVLSALLAALEATTTNTPTASDGAGHGTASATDGSLQARDEPIRQAAEKAREQGA